MATVRFHLSIAARARVLGWAIGKNKAQACKSVARARRLIRAIEAASGSAAATSGLDRRTRHRTVRTKYATIAGQWLKPFAAAFAVIEELAGVRRHVLGGLVSALGAGDGAYGLHQRAHMSTIAASTASASVVPSDSPFFKVLHIPSHRIRNVGEAKVRNNPRGRMLG